MALLLNSFLALLFLFFSGCSNKPYYSPEQSSLQDKRIPFIFRDSPKIERVEHNRVYLSNGLVLNENGDEVEISKEFKIDSDSVVWSRSGDLLAYTSLDNYIVVKNIATGEKLFEERYPSAITVDRKLPRPFFDGRGKILFFTLNGKAVLYSTEVNRVIREFTVSEADDYSNVIDYKLDQEKLILISHRTALLIKNEYDKRLDLDIRGAIFESDGSTLIITKSGEVKRFDSEFRETASIKFPFAYFVSFGEIEDKIYLIESQGYVIEMSRDFSDYRVIHSELDNENCFFTPQKFICDEKYFRVPLSI